MTGLIKYKIFCCLPTAFSDEVGGDVVVDYQGPFGLDSGAEAMPAVSAKHSQVSLSWFSNRRTEAQQ